MNRLISPGIYLLLLLAIGGIWLVISPFTMETQPAGTNWTVTTINNVAAGAVLIIVPLIALFVYLGLALRDTIRMASERIAERAQAEVEESNSRAVVP